MLASYPTTNFSPSLRIKAAAELELRRRRADRRAVYADHPAAFIHDHMQLFNATNERWEPFILWPAQREVSAILQAERRVIILKARQLGLTWLSLAHLLYAMTFGIATVGIFSRIETDSADLLYNRLRPMYDRLPAWARMGRPVIDNKSHFELPNGSSARAFATNGGRQYTFSHLLVDEADFQEDLPGLLNAVEPTIDAGGRLWLISTIDKSQPMSRFKSIYRAAVAGDNAYAPVFLSWDARPDRTNEWYEERKADKMANTGSLDDLHQEYPATDTEALAPRSLDKRIPPAWLEACYRLLPGISPDGMPALPGLIVWIRPHPGRTYILGADPAEGNPTSDESALCVLDKLTGEEVAGLAGRFDPTVLAAYAAQLAAYYNRAVIMPERNNHGHAFIAWFAQNGGAPILSGPDGKPGWNSNSLGKSLMYDRAADAFRDAVRDKQTLLHGMETFMQLSQIEGSTLRAPAGMHDDRADAWALANAGRLQIQPPSGFAVGAVKGWQP